MQTIVLNADGSMTLFEDPVLQSALALRVHAEQHTCHCPARCEPDEHANWEARLARGEVVL